MDQQEREFFRHLMGSELVYELLEGLIPIDIFLERAAKQDFKVLARSVAGLGIEHAGVLPPSPGQDLTRRVLRNNAHEVSRWEEESRTITIPFGVALLGLALLLGTGWLTRWLTRRRRR